MPCSKNFLSPLSKGKSTEKEKLIARSYYTFSLKISLSTRFLFPRRRSSSSFSSPPPLMAGKFICTRLRLNPPRPPSGRCELFVSESPCAPTHSFIYQFHSNFHRRALRSRTESIRSNYLITPSTLSAFFLRPHVLEVIDTHQQLKYLIVGSIPFIRRKPGPVWLALIAHET